MTTQKRTPGPWYVDETKAWGFCVRSRTKNVRQFHDGSTKDAFISAHLNQADAEFIVRACNSHDELLAACKAVAETPWIRTGGRNDEFLRLVDAAIAKAAGEVTS